MRKPIIYVVDDEPVNRIILIHGFKEINCIVREFSDGESTLRQLEREVPDLVILDVNMPGMDGFEVCKSIKQNPYTHEIPVIFITGNDEKEQRQNGLKIGAVDYIIKPFDVDEIRLRVQQQLRMREMYLKIKKQNNQMKKDILSARKLQFNLLPENNYHINENLKFFFEYYPCDSLGGDFLDILPLDENHYLFYMIDVSGHGIASSLVTIFVKEFFYRYKNKKVDDYNPAKILQKLNESILAVNFSDKYLTIFLGILDINNYNLIWSSAGPNTKPLIISENGIEQLENQALAVGWFPKGNWTNQSVHLPENCSLILYSDAAIEIKDTNDTVLDIDGLKKIFIENDFVRTLDFEVIVHDLLDFANAISFNDDLTFLALSRGDFSNSEEDDELPEL